MLDNGSLPLVDQSEALNRTFDDWRGTDREQLDDVMLLAIQL